MIVHIRSARMLATTCSVVVGLVWLHGLGRSDLATPPVSVDGFTAWLADRDAVLVAFSFLRLLAIAAGWYLIAVTVATHAASVGRAPALARLVDRCTFSWARGVVGSVALLGVMGGPAPSSEAPDTATMREIPGQGVTTVPPTTAGPSASIEPLPLESTAREPEPAPAPEDSTWLVQPGDSFWSIASDRLSELSGRPVTDREVTPYWRALVDANRPRLVHPDDPDLIFVGQEVELPDPGVETTASG